MTSNTIRSYDTQVAALSRIAKDYGIRLDRPLSEHDLCLAMVAYAQSHKPTTYPQFASAVNNWSRTTFNVDLPRRQLYDNTVASLRNLYGNVDFSVPKAALTVEDLVAIYSQLDTRYFEHARDWCAILLAFFGLLRISEYMNAGLRVRHVQRVAAGLDVTVLCSKTSAAPATISVSCRNDILCPLRAFNGYYDFLKRLNLSQRQDDPLFVFRFGNGVDRFMTDSQFVSVLRTHVKAAFPGRDASLYAGHSLRRGGATAMILAGVPEPVLKAHGRWSSDTYQRYYDSAHNASVRLEATRSLASTRL